MLMCGGGPLTEGEIDNDLVWTKLGRNIALSIWEMSKRGTLPFPKVTKAVRSY
jgi:hypothetical protein